MYKFKTILFTLMLLITLIGKTQPPIEIGGTEAEIRAELYNWVFYSRITDDSTYCIYSPSYVRGKVVYFFDEYGINDYSGFIPDRRIDLRFVKKQYNDKYVKLSHNKWYVDLPYKKVIIELKTKIKKSFFVYYEQLEPNN